MTKATLNDIVKQTGLSVATISRVLNDSGYVRPETRAIVEKAVRESGYRHTPRRKSVPHEISEIVLVITGDITSNVYTSHIQGITGELERTGKRVFIVNTDYVSVKEEDALRFACRNHFAGVIMLNAIETPGLVLTLRSARCPVVMVNRYLRSIDTDVVCIDNFRGGYMATDYLIRRGHQRIAHLAGPKNSITCQERLRGYNDAMHIARLPVRGDSIFYGDLQYESGLQFGRQICAMDAADRFTAVYCANDFMAAALADALLENGLRVPEDVSIICSDNTKNTVKGRVKLTAVDHDPVQMGISAAQMLLSRLASPNAKAEKIVYAPTLTERSSVRDL